ncbi:hypothetical protein [Marinobacter zhanjiangensis]|uniref:Uncharacterized protein n=1 Tax=Marinobacter zhanjiangensis TaxID=578215 RepID=A0ABQ3B557_9GAMM|nr:hypothetical protein [Marinobacter zhanjiangensis]GGY80173.1 hypothetical protein GCM10007071_29370 [Marinobacter zhanjiangensis]
MVERNLLVKNYLVMPNDYQYYIDFMSASVFRISIFIGQKSYVLYAILRQSVLSLLDSCTKPYLCFVFGLYVGQWVGVSGFRRKQLLTSAKSLEELSGAIDFRLPTSLLGIFGFSQNAVR